ncbi:retrovirus-related pol polyprotein from transposon TNT 1-94 [Tanacetum coccineum]|uniref:Retrovirus-related pol polyprotein from transposon TNT 1-94 n=1 Tax=Tanacetum coccineum TaxID=301880 RepID=A0ABQ4X0M5_9ASTR
MKNFLQSDIVWESKKEILVFSHPQKITPLVQSCQRDPEAPALSLINQGLLYLKKGNSGPKKIVLSLHKFPAIVFNDDDIEERTSRWLNKLFIRSSVTWERVHDFQLGIESYQQKINLTAPTITFPGIKEYDVFSIVYDPVHEIIYTNSKKEKKVMKPSEIHKFCDATLRTTLEGLKSYYNDVKYGYVKKELTNDELEFLKLFEEEIEVWLKYRDQIRRWEMVKSIAFKNKKEYSDDETSTSGIDDEEYAMAVRNFKKFFRRKGRFVRQPREEKKSFRKMDDKKGKSNRKCFRCGDPNYLIGECPKPPRNKD